MEGLMLSSVNSFQFSVFSFQFPVFGFLRKRFGRITFQLTASTSNFQPSAYNIQHSTFNFRLLSFLFLLVLSFNAMAQKVSWDSTSRPDLYRSQVDQFKSFEHTANDIVFLGNSLTHWTNWNEQLRMNNIRNRGIPGDITFGVLERMDEAVMGNPKKIFILIGINDVAKNIPDEVILNNYQRIISYIKKHSPKTKIYFQSMLPTNDSFKKLVNHYKNDRVVAINAALKNLAQKEKITFIDLYTAFADQDGKLKAELTYDGVHLYANGYALWTSILIKGKYLIN